MSLTCWSPPQTAPSSASSTLKLADAGCRPHETVGQIGSRLIQAAGQRGTVVDVDRVVIAGCAGSGKSTLARALAARTGLPLVERDRLGILGSDQYRAAVGRLAGEPRWILDGAPYYVDDLVYAAADTVVFLDYPKLVVMLRRATRARARYLILRAAPGPPPRA